MHSGQHYDDELSAVFFRELGVPAPDHELRRRLGAGRRADRADHARVRAGRSGDAQPDIALVYGDTNTTLAGALSCARMRLPLAHVESGMRSFDHSMPEERNRVLTDHLSDLLLCSTEVAVDEPGARGRHRGRRAGRRRDGRRRAGDGAGRARRRPRRASRLGRAAGRLPARDGAPGRQRGRSGGARPAGGDPAGAAVARGLSRASPHARAARRCRRPGAARAARLADRSRSRWAIWTSSRCCRRPPPW